MILHSVALRFRPEVTDEAIEQLAIAVDSLKDRVPGAISLVQGRDLAWRDGNADYAIVAVLDMDDPRDFFHHPAHLAVATEHVAPRVESLSSVQFPLAPGPAREVIGAIGDPRGAGR